MPEQSRLHLLGYPQIFKAGEVVSDFISNKVLLLFCYLILEKKVHARDSLSTLLWGDMPEQRAKANLRQALHNIQKLFPDCFDVNRQTVTVLDAGQWWVDALEVMRLSQQKDVLPEQLAEASALYRGEFLEGISVTEDFQLDDWLRGRRESSRIAYMTVLEKLARHYTAAALWQAAQSTLTRLIHLEPWKESYHRDLMICLARQGDYTTAITQYEHCQQMLMDEFGEEPSYETQRVYEGILAARYRPQRTMDEDARQLFGRHAEIQHIESQLHDPQYRLITITGQGGIGKTHLVRHIGARNEMQFLNGTVFLALNTITDEHHLIHALRNALNLASTQAEDARKGLMDYLQSKEILLILDNFEHLLSCVTLIEQILVSAPHVTLLVTSRTRLNLKQEYVIELAGLSIPEPDKVSQSEAAQLFVERARQIQPNFTLDNEVAFLEICKHVNGMPLALELAAGWVDTLPLDAIYQEMQHNMDLLRSSLHNIPERHRSIRNLFDQTWQHFSEQDQTLLLTLTVFRGSFSYEAAQSVANASPFALRTFVSKAWLQTTSDNRFVFHELTRQYLEIRIADTAFDLTAAKAAHATYFAAYFQRLDGELFDNAHVLGAIEAMKKESDNADMAWQWAIENCACEHVDRMMESYFTLYAHRAQYQELVRMMQQVVALFEEDKPDELLARLYIRLGRAHYYNGNRDGAQTAFEQGLQLAQHFENTLEVGHALHGLAACHMVHDWDMCERLLYESIAAYEAADNPVQAALARNTLAATLNFLGRSEDTHALYENIYQVLKAVNDARVATPLRGLTRRAVINGDYDYARALLDESRIIAEQTGNFNTLSSILQELGNIEFRLEHYDDARRFYEQALVVSRQYGKPMTAVDSLGWVDLRQGRYTQAIQRFSQALRNSNNLDFYMIVLTHCVELFILTERLELATALANLVFLHPATAHSTYTDLAKLLENSPITPPSPENRTQILPHIEQAMPRIVDVLHLPDTFFPSLLEQITQ